MEDWNLYDVYRLCDENILVNNTETKPEFGFQSAAWDLKLKNYHHWVLWVYKFSSSYLHHLSVYLFRLLAPSI